MDAATRQLVRTRASDRCEYCRISQAHYINTFHVEHIVAKQHQGGDDAANLALACHYCNRYKGPNLSGIDPLTRQLTRLYHPRTDSWDEHFRVQDGVISGLTAVGRTTAWLLNMNAPDRLRLRLSLESEFFS